MNYFSFSTAAFSDTFGCDGCSKMVNTAEFFRFKLRMTSLPSVLFYKNTPKRVELNFPF